MSTSFRPLLKTYTAKGTITPYCAVKFSVDNQSVVAAGAGDQAFGISQNDANIVSGQKVEVAMPGGGAKWTVGAILAGLGPTLCKSDAAGSATKASDTDWVVALVTNTAAVGDIVECFVQPHYAGATQS